MEAGRYKGRAIELEFGNATTGTEQIGVAIEVTQGDCIGESIAWYGYFSDKAAPYTIANLRKMGWKGDDLAALSIADLTDEFDFGVKVDVYEGNESLKVSWIGSGGVAMKSTMDPAQKKAFAARMKGLCVATKGGVAPKPAARPQRGNGADPGSPPPMPGDDAAPGKDDLPF